MKWVIAGFVSLAFVAHSWADDVEIYYSTFGGSSKPLVMLTLDLRSN